MVIGYVAKFSVNGWGSGGYLLLASVIFVRGLDLRCVLVMILGDDF